MKTIDEMSAAEKAYVIVQKIQELKNVLYESYDDEFRLLDKENNVLENQLPFWLKKNLNDKAASQNKSCGFFSF